ncbi:Putative transposase y4zB [Bacteroidales bacterium CF]|jgi:Transposase DDE domain.|nr:Putative transposase y4zB [Bacteroidales bacterium CF]
MNSGKYVFSQSVEFLPRYEFERLVKKFNGNFHARNLSCYNQFLHLLFGQLTACDSLRDICLCLKAHQRVLYHLGFRQTVDESSLSRANERRDYRIYEELGYILIDIVRPMFAEERIPELYCQDYDVFALDSTTISCSIKLLSWALGKYTKGAVKMHTVIDLRGSIPVFIDITDGRYHDSNFLDIIDPVSNAIYTMDKAYVDFKALFRINQCDSFFITRAKETMQHEIVETNYNVDESTGLRGDHIIKLTGYKSSSLYPSPMRLIEYYDSESGEYLRFVTNSMDLNALEIADLYRRRWDIECFFKWIKQNLTIKKFWGHSENAVKTHLWVAICTFLIIARIKARYKSSYTITEVATILSVSALEKIDLDELLTNPELLSQNQNVNEPILF